MSLFWKGEHKDTLQSFADFKILGVNANDLNFRASKKPEKE
jgi:hypothetical protein